ncbi:MAG: CoA-binding protein, partial [Spirochaetota bacterium]|nr:CoA-binding protein [Spirochaetota bacterium]
LKPKSVAVIGATERAGAWGSFIMEGLQGMNFYGKIYPVTKRADTVYGLKAFADVRDIPDPVDLSVLAIPEHMVEENLKACGEKGVKGVIMITAGFSEAVVEGREREIALSKLARSYGMRILGPNVSGTFNLHARFSASPAENLFATKLAAVCQGGYAFYDLLVSARERKMGVGKFIHTGNECDTDVTDFLEYFETDNEVDGIIMYLETIRGGRRFVEVAARVSQKKPIIVHKVGRTESGVRAANSHTGALSGPRRIYDGVFNQTNIILSPTMELLLPLAHAAIERPPMRGKNVAIITMGGSWGVPLTDCLEEQGLIVPELSYELQKKLRDLGMPIRASTKNPVDIGAAGVGSLSPDVLSEISRIMLDSGEIDALILHGLGRPGMLDSDSSVQWKFFMEHEKAMMTKVSALEIETGKPVMMGALFTPWESQTVHDLNNEGMRIYNCLEDIARILSLMYRYWQKKENNII